MVSESWEVTEDSMEADDEFEHDNVSEHSRSVRKYLLDQGNIPIDDSDDSTTYSNSSPVVKHKVYQEPQDMVDSIEEVLETEEIDDKGNRIVRKVIQKRVIPKLPKVSESKSAGYSSDISEK